MTRTQRYHIEVGIVGAPFYLLTHQIKLSLQVITGDVALRNDNDLNRARLCFKGRFTQFVRTYRHFPPMSNLHTGFLCFLFNDGGELCTSCFIFGQEHQTRSVTTSFRYRYSLQQNKLVRYLHQDAGAVARFLVSPFSSSVSHVFEHRQCLVYQ